MTRVLKIDPDRPDPGVLAEAAGVLRSGGLVAFPTETVYGLGADATNPVAVARIFEAKGRPPSNPLIVHADGLAMARTCVLDWDRWGVDVLARRWWPGPLTIVLPASPLIPRIVTAGHETVGVRVPGPEAARGLIRLAGRPIAAPSANRSNRVSPTRAEHVLKDLEGRVDLILDGGTTSVGLESTVVDMTRRYPRVLRPGPISAADLINRSGLSIEFDRPGLSEESGDVSSLPPSPGRLPVHYAPSVPAFWVEPEHLADFPWPADAALLGVGWLDLPEPLMGTRRVDLATPEAAARELYASLHAFEEAGVACIVVVPPPATPEWEAVRDRLARATRSYRQGDDPRAGR